MSKELSEWGEKTLPKIGSKIEDINLYLSYDYKTYEIMSIEELLEIIWELKKYSLEIKINSNKEKAKSRWLYTTINKIAKPECEQYKSYDKDERLYSVIKESDNLKKFLQMKIDSDYKSDALDGIEKGINNLVYILKNLHDYKISKKSFEKGVKNDNTDA